MAADHNPLIAPHRHIKLPGNCLGVPASPVPAGLEEKHLFIQPIGEHAQTYQKLFPQGMVPMDLIPQWAQFLAELPEKSRVRFRIYPEGWEQIEGLTEVALGG
jgi:hypothetical protein